MTTPLVYYPGILAPIVHPISDGITHLSAVQQSSFTTLAPVTNTVTSEWQVIAYRINSSVESLFDSYYRVHVVRNASTPGLSSPVTHPVDWHYLNPQIVWEVDRRTSAHHAVAWMVIDRRSSYRKALWNVRNPVTTTKAAHFRVRKAVTATVAIDWKLYAKIVAKEKSLFNVYTSRTIQKQVAWNTLDKTATATVAASWMTRKHVIASKASNFNTITRTSRSRATSWMTLKSLTKTQAEKFMTLGFVSNTAASAWSVQQLVKRKYISEFRVLDSATAGRRMAWNTLTRVTKAADTISARNTVYGPVVHPLDAFGYTYWPTSSWRYITHVSSSVESLFDIYSKVDPRVAIAWKLSQRRSATVLSQWNVRNPVVLRPIIEWNVGLVLDYPIRMTSAPRTDFAY